MDQEQADIPIRNTEVGDRQTYWQQLVAEVNEYRDGLGKRVDEGIKPAVVALNALGFETNGSCEGHLERGQAFPWIDITASGSDSKFEEASAAFTLADQAEEKKLPEMTLSALYKRAHTLNREAHEPITREAARMLPILDEFYLNRAVSYTKRITLKILGSRFRLESQGSEIQSILPEAEKRANLDSYRHEMSDFSQFLKDRYFKQ